jgi:hypothetical protein
MYRACSAKTDTATELRASQVQSVAEVPQQGRISVTLEETRYAVYLELNRVCHIVATDESQTDRIDLTIITSSVAEWSSRTGAYGEDNAQADDERVLSQEGRIRSITFTDFSNTPLN